MQQKNQMIRQTISLNEKDLSYCKMKKMISILKEEMEIKNHLKVLNQKT